MDRIMLLVLGAFFSTVTVATRASFNPEEMLFIFTRCMEDNLRDDSSRQSTLQNWIKWDLEPAEDSSTHCYVKCLLEKTGLYDPMTEQFHHEVIKDQWEKFQDLAEKEKADAFANAVKELPITENDCSAVFNAYRHVHKAFKDTSRNLFHGNKELTKKIYEEMGVNIKQKKQSYIEFCENKFYPVGSPDRAKVCQMRQYVLFDDSQFKKHVDCFMKGFRYLTNDNVFDRVELKRDFQQVNKDTVELEKVLDTCQTQEPKKDEDKALHYYTCLLESSVVDDFKEALDYREVRSQNYGLNLAEKQEYRRSHVVSDVKVIDGKQCSQW